MAKYPTPDQIKTLLEGPADTPVVMLNLLKFNRVAESSGGRVSGEEAYRRYAVQMRKLVESKGGRFIWAGRADSLVIGETDEEFDMVGLVECPSRAAFLEIASSQQVQEISGDRAAGLDHQWLIACTAQPLGDV